LAAALLATGLTSCSDNDDSADNKDRAFTYAQVTITIPNGGSGTRADGDNSEEYDTGEEAEYAVKSAKLYFCKDGAVKSIVNVLSFTKESDYAASPSTSSGMATYRSNAEPITLAYGTYDVYAIVNSDPTSIVSGSETSDLEDAVYNSSKGSLGNTIPSTGIPMSSRADDGTLKTSVTLSAENTESNPAAISLVVERAWGKVALKASSKGNQNNGSTAAETNEYAVYKDNDNKKDQIGTIKLSHYLLFNLPNTDGYVFRHVGNLTEAGALVGSTAFTAITTAGTSNSYSEGAAPYLIEPQTTSKTFTSSTLATLNPALVNGTETTMPTTTDSYTKLAYLLENSMYKGFQKQGYVTGIIFTGVITPKTVIKTTTSGEDDYTQGESDLYYLNYAYYSSLEAIKYANSSLSGITTENYGNYGIKKYTGGKCYYKYWIKHWDNGIQGVMGAMEYAIVRNNVYNLKVTDLLLPGDENQLPTDDEKKEDVETNKVYIRVALNIKPWIVRNQSSIVLGK